jgi:hypothetical protein
MNISLQNNLTRQGCHRNVVILWNGWQSKLRLFRKLAKGWSANLIADIRKHKKMLMEEYYFLDIKAENLSLTDGEKDRLNTIFTELNN